MKSPSNQNADDHLFTTFSFNTEKKLTMIPTKYRLKEERRKVLKISLNKLKKIDDPESSLRRSVLINNTMKKLQKEAREEKLQKQHSICSKTFLLNNNEEKTTEECCYPLNDSATADTDCLHSRPIEGVCLNEDIVQHIPSIKRCSSRKRSLDEDGPASEVLNLNETDLDCKKIEEVEDCEVHDVLSQLYLPPTPRMVTSIDSDTDDEELCQNDKDIVNSLNDLADDLEKETEKCEKRKLEDSDGNSAKKLKKCDSFDLSQDVCHKHNKENFRTKFNNYDNCDDELIELEDEEDVERRLSQSYNHYKKMDPSKNTNGYYNETPSGNNLMENCESQFSCGHSSIFNEIQSASFHNLIASLET